MSPCVGFFVSFDSAWPAHVAQYDPPFGAIVHCVNSSWFDRMPLHHPSITTPQNGRDIDGVTIFSFFSFGTRFDFGSARDTFAADSSRNDTASASSNPYFSDSALTMTRANSVVLATIAFSIAVVIITEVFIV
jgi:hypothetical protein